MNNSERDYELFPDDSIGAMLWHMKSIGDSLTTPREINFSAVFATEENALKFAVICLRQGFKVEMFETEPNVKDDLDWAVWLYTHLIPSYSEISQLEAFVTEQAEELGGKLDGLESDFVKSD